jgi:hypothetical protein
MQRQHGVRPRPNQARQIPGDTGNDSFHQEREPASAIGDGESRAELFLSFLRGNSLKSFFFKNYFFYPCPCVVNAFWFWLCRAALCCGLIGAMDEPIQLPIDGVLDLHGFKPREIKDLVLDYLEACRERGILEVRIIHGKGIGELRRTVHSILSKHPGVISFSPASEHFGGWGATIVHLQRLT